MPDDAPMPSGTGPASASQTWDDPVVRNSTDPLIALFKKDVDRTLLIDNLRRTVDERARRMNNFLRALETLHTTRPAWRR